MDARIDPCAAFGISLGDAHVIRNAGASARDALRSLIISQQLLGTREILLVKHTGCGMLTFTNEDARGIVKDRFGEEVLAREKKKKEQGGGSGRGDGVDIETLDFLPFADLEEAVREDLRFLKDCGVVLSGGPNGEEGGSSGWIYEVETGKVRPVAKKS